ncbi:MAG: phosphatidylserine decarboxylase, partial [Elusimicrobia bacterium]|nr:phosphatidylserine decarboxylase [Elusimicrobiota bacterium]
FIGFLFLFFGLWFAKLVGVLCVLLAVFSVSFFRDPERAVPATGDVLSPADGTVLEVLTTDGEGYGPGRVVRIFLSVFDVHIQRSPVAGQVKSIRYQPGIFLDARDPRAAFANESNAIEIESENGRILVKQIAGLVARRIVCWVRPEDGVAAGERVGLIRFGSQVDLYVPSDVEIVIKEGDKVVGGETVVGRWPARKRAEAVRPALEAIAAPEPVETEMEKTRSGGNE